MGNCNKKIEKIKIQIVVTLHQSFESNKHEHKRERLLKLAIDNGTVYDTCTLTTKNVVDLACASDNETRHGFVSAINKVTMLHVNNIDFNKSTFNIYHTFIKSYDLESCNYAINNKLVIPTIEVFMYYINQIQMLLGNAWYFEHYHGNCDRIIILTDIITTIIRKSSIDINAICHNFYLLPWLCKIAATILNQLDSKNPKTNWVIKNIKYITQQLIKLNADININNSEPLRIAHNNMCMPLVSYLLEIGAKVPDTIKLKITHEHTTTKNYSY
jgi:hypothetical protein